VERKGRRFVHAVDGVSFRVRRGTTFGIVGESGSGKSTTAQAVMRLVPATSGQIVFRGRDIAEISGEPLREVRRFSKARGEFTGCIRISYTSINNFK
jgi:ABC-type oligopeptide transport system ATPase subunit